MLTIENLSIYKQEQILIKDLNVQVTNHELLAIMGASGSGKSTILNWIIGTLDSSFQAKGRLFLNGKQLDSLPTEQRQIGILFQDDLLFPHLSVGDNLAFALPAHLSKTERASAIHESLTQAGLEKFAKRDPATLSGGQRARVSLLRALLAQPKALLLDEPFSKLDMTLRQQFRETVYQHIQQQAIPTILVTHDPQDIPANATIIHLESSTCSTATS